MRGKPHSDETKAAVVSALMAGQGVNEVAEQYKLPRSVVSGWKKGIGDEQFEQVRTKKGERIEGLLFDYLEANLLALTAQANLVADEAYLRKYPPQQIALLHGVMADKSVRLLEALGGQQGAEPAADAQPS